MSRGEIIEYCEGLRKTFSSQLEKEENHFGRLHLQTTIGVLDMTIDSLEREKIYKSTLFKIGETLVDESKLHITSEEACEQIREYLKQKDLKLSQLKEIKEC